MLSIQHCLCATKAVTLFYDISRNFEMRGKDFLPRLCNVIHEKVVLPSSLYPCVMIHPPSQAQSLKVEQWQPNDTAYSFSLMKAPIAIYSEAEW